MATLTQTEIEKGKLVVQNAAMTETVAQQTAELMEWSSLEEALRDRVSIAELGVKRMEVLAGRVPCAGSKVWWSSVRDDRVFLDGNSSESAECVDRQVCCGKLC